MRPKVTCITMNPAHGLKRGYVLHPDADKKYGRLVVDTPDIFTVCLRRMMIIERMRHAIGLPVLPQEPRT